MKYGSKRNGKQGRKINTKYICLVMAAAVVAKLKMYKKYLAINIKSVNEWKKI